MHSDPKLGNHIHVIPRFSSLCAISILVLSLESPFPFHFCAKHRVKPRHSLTNWAGRVWGGKEGRGESGMQGEREGRRDEEAGRQAGRGSDSL